MATILLSAAGAWAGAAAGGGALGLSGIVLGRAAGATLGRVIDNAILGAGAEPVRRGRVDRLRLTGASEGAPVPRVYGRMRVGGQVIWATRFREHKQTSGGKGLSPAPKVETYSYTISLAVALCEGEIARIGRIWADGEEIAPEGLNLRLYTGSEAQLPDPLIVAVEGEDNAPAYRGIAYVVIEDLDITRHGNRVPQLNFEVIRHAPADQPEAGGEIAHATSAVALIPGTGEYALATSRVHYDHGPGKLRAANAATASGRTDMGDALSALVGDLPSCNSVSLVVSWFGDDLRVGECQLRPMVEQASADGREMPWQVSGLTRATAPVLPQDASGGPLYGGTPADASVIEAIQALRAAGQAVLFYPFVLMTQQPGNGLPDPYGRAEQPALPWRGRITTALAPDKAGTSDGTAAAASEVAAFFGAAEPEDFTPGTGTVEYSGPAEFSLRRMILHYAHLCAMAGGVDAFVIGSELRGITRIRDDAGFPAVDELVRLAQDVRSILGPETKISYAADWTEYAGYQTPQGDLRFPLDPLWASPHVDFIGIDNYMPLSDWRDGEDHADAAWGAIHDQGYLRANIEGGEGYDWYYAGEDHAASQTRTPITDGAYGEPWVWRVKDIRNWWQNPHFERVEGVREDAPTLWQPRSKPVWFTEMGCAAIDKGTNAPNLFLDPRSSESALPRGSDGSRDDAIQAAYIRAMTGFWGDPANNPVSPVYGGPMIDMSRAHVWAWDARPFPAFPGRGDLWADGDNYTAGHWLTGRASNRDLAGVVREICRAAGIADALIDTSALHGTLRGYIVAETQSARAALEPLLLAYGIDVAEREGRLVFCDRAGRRAALAPEPGTLAMPEGADSAVALTRAAAAEMAGRVRLTHVEAEADFALRAEEAVHPEEAGIGASGTELPLALTGAEARRIVHRWLAEARIGRDTARFALPQSALAVGAGDVMELGGTRYRIDRLTQGLAREAEAVRVEGGAYRPPAEEVPPAPQKVLTPPVPLLHLWMDLPLLTGEEAPHAPHLAVSAAPWPGDAALYAAAQDAGYALDTLLPEAAVIGVTETDLPAAPPARWDRGPALRVRLVSGALEAADPAAVLAGANVAAISDGSGEWEVIQFAGASLVAPDTWEIETRLRGQAGSDGLAAAWAPGAWFVLLDGAPRQIALPASARGLERHYRTGPASVPPTDPRYVHEVRAFTGIGLRPYAPAHLRARRGAAGAWDLSWIRRTRIGGDSWEGPDVPLGEDTERYLLTVGPAGAPVRSVTLDAPAFTYTAAMQAEDALTPPYTIAVAQVSQTFGPGHRTEITIHD